MHENYIDTLIDILKSPLSKDDFEEVMGRAIPVLYTQWNEEGFDNLSSDHYLELLTLLRRKIVGFIKQGELIDNNYINLYFLFREANIHNDEETQNLIQLLEKTYQEYREDQKEKFIFAHLLFVLTFLNGDTQRALRVFLSEHLYFDGVSYDSMNKNGEMLKSFLTSHRIVFEEVSEILAYGLDKENFIHRSPHQRHSAMIWMLRFFWQIDGYMNHNGWRSVIYPKLLDLFHFYLSDNNAIETVMHLHFLMSHLYMNSAQTQEEFRQFNDEVEIKGSEYNRQWGECAGLEKAKFANHGEKTKIALIKDRIVRNSPSKVEFSLLRQLLNNEEFTKAYTITIYTLSIVEKSLDDQTLINELRELGIIVKESATETLNYSSTYQSHLLRALAVREDMQCEGIDIMIAATNNFPEVSFLFSTLSVPTQMYWSHGNFQYDVIGIDQKITHFAIPKDAASKYMSFLVEHSQETNNPLIESARIQTERTKFPSNSFVLGTIGRLIKLNSEQYLESIREIMDRNPQTIYLACGLGDDHTLKEKVKRMGLEDRFYFPGFVDPHLYGHIIDLYLDTFPLPSGESLTEYAEKGKPYLLMIDYDALNDTLRIEHDRFVRIHGKARPFAFSQKDYIEVANYLISNGEALEKVAQYIRAEYVDKKPGSSAYYRQEIENYGAKGFVNLLEQSARKKEKDALLQMARKQEEDKKALFEAGVKKYRSEFEKVVSESTDKNGIDINRMLFTLSTGLLEKRMYLNYFLAEYYFKSKNTEQAKIFVDRAWLFSRFDTNILPLYLQIHESLQDYEAIREAYKRLGMEEAKMRNIANAISYFNQWHYVEAMYRKADIYRYDFDIIDAIERMAEPYRFTHEPVPKKVEGKTKIAFLVFGLSHANSSLIKSNKLYFKHLDMESNRVEIFVIDSKKEVTNRIEAMGHIFEFQRLGCRVHLFEDRVNKVEKLLEISKSIYDFGADILMTGAAMAEMEHAFVIATQPAPKTVGFLLGPPEQFCYPFMDEIVGYSYHPLFDAPVKKSAYQQSTYAKTKSNRSIKYSDLGIPESATVLISSGRHTKFQNADYWKAIVDILIEYSHSYYLVVGIEFDQVSDYIDERIKERIVFLGWVNNPQEYLMVSDIVLDTYPSGGGYTVADAMSLGIPVVVFENDFLKKFNQNDWSVAYELANIPALTVKRGNFSLFKELLSRLIKDEALRADLGQKCKHYFDTYMSDEFYVSHIFDK